MLGPKESEGESLSVLIKRSLWVSQKPVIKVYIVICAKTENLCIGVNGFVPKLSYLQSSKYLCAYLLYLLVHGHFHLPAIACHYFHSFIIQRQSTLHSTIFKFLEIQINTPR